jgi:hypothetical protein
LFQDFSQLTRDYGKDEAQVIINTVGNVFSGLVVGDTAKTLSERFGKNLQQRKSVSINRNDTSQSISTHMDSLIPASKITSLSQGKFVGAVADNFGEEITQKYFHANIIVDSDKVKSEESKYNPIPVIRDFVDEENGKDIMEEIIKANYNKIKSDVKMIVEKELQNINCL